MKHLENFKLFEAKKTVTDADAEFFQSIIGKKFKCKKNYNYRKNSLTNTFAYVDDIMRVENINFLINPKGKHYISEVTYKQLSKSLENGDTIQEFKVNVKNLTKRKENNDWWRSDCIPAIKSKKQFLTYFEEI